MRKINKLESRIDILEQKLELRTKLLTEFAADSEAVSNVVAALLNHLELAIVEKGLIVRKETGK